MGLSSGINMIDALVLSGVSAQYTINGAAGGWVAEGSGRDVLAGVERLRFADDRAMALDIDGVAGQVYRLYKAAFDRAPDPTGIGFWIHSVDDGLSLQSLAEHFIRSDEFVTTYGQLDNGAFVALLYQNILGREPDAAGEAFHVDLLGRGVTSRNETLAAFSESAENQAALAGVLSYGIAYLPLGWLA
ncbi:DUF4214 domain-containing protein [Massilia cavernae]|uniref:DUF4214 domain-containing protein n=1 Tax=Massilia cavernae TaxID=2320864 RepID=A0A418Y8C3_9BURK|nr:DUF4214 domain-containing protein [Massilia cavernae]RJG27646.1 DUF4214 domain-containing protein [Massilia cavernae]